MLKYVTLSMAEEEVESEVIRFYLILHITKIFSIQLQIHFHHANQQQRSEEANIWIQTTEFLMCGRESSIMFKKSIHCFLGYLTSRCCFPLFAMCVLLSLEFGVISDSMVGFRIDAMLDCQLLLGIKVRNEVSLWQHFQVSNGNEVDHIDT